MKWRVRDKQSARKATVGAQAAAVVLVASGVAMGMLGPEILKVEQVAPSEPAPETSESSDSSEPVDPAQIDAVTVAENFEYLANRPQPDPEAPETAEAESPTEPQAEERGVRYVGSVRVGDRMSAWVNIGGVTKLLRPGGEYGQVRLVSVGDDEIVVSIDGGDEESVQKSQREGPAVTMVVGGAPAPEATPVVAGDEPDQPRFTPDMSREERRAMLLERARDERERSWRRDREESGEDGSPDRNQR
jgi:hypothetical protein